MKKQNLILLVLIAFTIIKSNTVFSQGNPYWKGGGNTNAGVDAITIPLNNFQIGTVAGNNVPVEIQTNGITRIRVNDNTGGTAGYVGIAKIVPSFQLCVGSHISIDTLIVYPTIANNQIGCYMIADTTVLHTNGIRCVSTGFGAGLSLKAGTHDNVYNGWDAGRLDIILFSGC